MDRQEILIVVLLGHPILEKHDSNLERLIVLEAGGLYVYGIKVRGMSLLFRLQSSDDISLLSSLFMFAHDRMR